MVTAFARALKIEPEYLLQNLEHDGLGFFEGTTVQRTHHVQEIMDVAVALGCVLCPIELVPRSTNGRDVFNIFFGDGTVAANFDRFKMHIDGNEGVIQGEMNGEGHAVYWDGEKCIDSRGEWNLWGNDFAPGVFWRAVWI